MKRKILCLVVVCALLGAFAVPAYAQSFTSSKYNVTFTGKKLVSNYPALVNLEGNMQPGDDVTQIITINNSYTAPAYWYVTNEVLKSLEDNSIASGGAYSYVFSVTVGNSTRVLYNSTLVGGATKYTKGMGALAQSYKNYTTKGLIDATQGLQTYVYLGQVPAGGSGQVSLRVGLDGRSQINRYQNTNAKLRVNFAVELNPSGKYIRGVRTGDYLQTAPFIVLTACSGVALLGMGFVAVKKSRRRESGRQ